MKKKVRKDIGIRNQKQFFILKEIHIKEKRREKKMKMEEEERRKEKSKPFSNDKKVNYLTEKCFNQHVKSK